jgi:hypothetical protein
MGKGQQYMRELIDIDTMVGLRSEFFEAEGWYADDNTVLSWAMRTDKEEEEEVLDEWYGGGYNRLTFEEKYTSLPGDYYGRYGQPDPAQRKQVGGTHYQMAIQPIDYITKNHLGYIEGNIIKYVTRYKSKNGIEDLKKAQHYLEMLIEEEEKNAVSY